MSYGPNIPDLSRRAAVFVVKILQGAKAATCRVEQPTTFELAINLKAAKLIGLTIPPTLLARADSDRIAILFAAVQSSLLALSGHP